MNSYINIAQIQSEKISIINMCKAHSSPVVSLDNNDIDLVSSVIARSRTCTNTKFSRPNPVKENGPVHTPTPKRDPFYFYFLFPSFLFLA
jgi:hypothetical protein